MKPLRPTTDTFNLLQEAYDHFNRTLFNDQLGPCMILVHRKAQAHGYYWPKQFQEIDGGRVVDEIAINPDSMKRPTILVLSTLVHEMCHLWQENFGKPGRKAYHNREWADKMEAVGLIPSDTGEVGGKRTGQSMTHYIDANGNFERAAKKFLTKNRQLRWATSSFILELEPPEKKNKTKYHCACGTNVWGRPGLKLKCEECKQRFQETS